MSKYDGVFCCAFCGEFPVKDKEVKRIIEIGVMLWCPKCKQMSYAHSLKAKFKANYKKWVCVKGASL